MTTASKVWERIRAVIRNGANLRDAYHLEEAGYCIIGDLAHMANIPCPERNQNNTAIAVPSLEAFRAALLKAYPVLDEAALMALQRMNDSETDVESRRTRLLDAVDYLERRT